jgi:hypothetical protein
VRVKYRIRSSHIKYFRLKIIEINQLTFSWEKDMDRHQWTEQIAGGQEYRGDWLGLKGNNS